MVLFRDVGSVNGREDALGDPPFLASPASVLVWPSADGVLELFRRLVEQRFLTDDHARDIVDSRLGGRRSDVLALVAGLVIRFVMLLFVGLVAFGGLSIGLGGLVYEPFGLGLVFLPFGLGRVFLFFFLDVSFVAVVQQALLVANGFFSLARLDALICAIVLHMSILCATLMLGAFLLLLGVTVLRLVN